MLRRVSEVEDKSGLKFEMSYPDITGFNVFDNAGNDVGEVQDLVLNTNTGMVDHAIIGRGWFASLFGEKQVIVPFDRMTVNPDDRSVRLDISREDLRNFPDWTDISQEGLSDRISSWWRGRMKAA